MGAYAEIFDASSNEVLKNPNTFSIRNCHTCGKEYAILKYTTRLKPRNCSKECSNIWIKKKNDPMKLMDLYYYNTMIPSEFEITENNNDFYTYTQTEMDIIMILKSQEKGKDDYWLTEKIFGYRETKKGFLSYRSSVVKACQSLIKKGVLRKYKSKTNDNKGRPKTKYVRTRRIVHTTKECPYCRCENYYVIKETQKIKCIQCGLEWRV